MCYAQCKQSRFAGWLKDGSSVRLGVDDVSLLSACLMDDACATVRAVVWTCNKWATVYNSSLLLLLVLLLSTRSLCLYVSVSASYFLRFCSFSASSSRSALSMLMSAPRCACIVSRRRRRLRSLVCFLRACHREIKLLKEHSLSGSSN